MSQTIKNSHQYDDIIHLPHPTSKVHPRMSMRNRAAQFAPFAALTGYEDAIDETKRLTTRRKELDEHEQAILDEKMNGLLEKLEAYKEIGIYPEISVTYFEPDEKKEGGQYLTEKTAVKKVDFYLQTLVLQNGKQILLADIIELDY